MSCSITNIFCIIANVGSGHEMYIKHILDDRHFSKSLKLTRLIYNTTKPIDKKDEDYKLNKYKHYSTKEYEEIPKSELIDYRSYYTIPYNDIVYFTFRKDIENKDNLIAIVSPYQYENYKRWAAIENFKEKTQYHIYAIMVHCSLRNRFYNKVVSSNKYDDDTFLEFCRRVLQDNAEFNNVKTRMPEFDDPMSCDNVCYIDNDDHGDECFKANLAQIKGFIADKIKSD